MGKDCPFKHSQKKRIDLPVLHEKRERSRKRVRQRKGNGCNREYCKSPFKDDFRKALAIRNFHEHPHDRRGKLWASGTSHSGHERHSCARTGTSVRKDKHQILASKIGKSKIHRQVSISERNPNGQKKREISKCTTVWPKVYRVEWGVKTSLQGIKHTIFTKSSSR